MRNDDEAAPVRFVQVEHQKANDNAWKRLMSNVEDGTHEATITK